MAEGMAEIRVTGLNIFPIKSCKACKTDAVQIDSYGVVGDRRFMLVDGTRRFISQRKTPVLATVTARYDQAEGGGTVLHASAPSMGRDLVVIPVLEGERVEVTVWDDSVMAIDQGEDAAKWFSELLGLGVSYIRLMASAESSGGFHRKVANVPQSLQAKLPRFNIPFTDAAPVSIVSEQSLAELNQRMLSQTGHEAPLNRFRMNIEVSGCSKPYEEDEWLLIRIGAVPFIVYIANERCKMTGINQQTGEVDKVGPLDVLRQYRAPEGPDHAKFGQYMFPLQLGGSIQVGDKVEVMDRKKF